MAVGAVRLAGAVFCSTLLATAEAATARDASPFAQRLTRALSATQRDDERALGSLRERLAKLPPLSPGHRGENAGFHSRFQPHREAPFELVIDLAQPHPVSRIAVFPVRGMFRGATVEGYGFPTRFVIELALDAAFTEPVLHFDSHDVAPSPRPDYPVQFVAPKPVTARYLRLRVLEHWTREDGRFLSAFGEIMALANGRNVALRAAVEANAFNSLPDWHRDHLVDGQTDLGLPVDPEPSPTNGFLSRSQDRPVTTKWIQIKLPQSARIEDVVLIPTQPVDAPDQFGHGFPRRFRVLVSEDAGFAAARVLGDYRDVPFPNPGGNPVAFPAQGVSARYVRLEVDELWHISNHNYSLALAEIQAIEAGRNVALGAEVTASDVFDIKRYLHVWRPEFLVDGYSSQNRLIKLEDWLEGLDKRRDNESEINRLSEQMEQRVERTTEWALGVTALVAVLSVGMIGMMLLRRKRILAEQQEALRARIARDLHDDLGSRLGGMRLLSENILGSTDLPPDLRADLDLLHRSSEEATDAMRDLVWLLDSREASLGRFVQQMRRLLPSIVGALPCDFQILDAPDAEVAFDFRRQVLFAFRESLYNAVRHSGSPRIACRTGGDTARFWFEVRDWGEGFREDTLGTGHGLANLRKRAEALGGNVAIESKPGEGTTVTFTAPLQRPLHRQHP
jgi:signal transduction histidine kinase